MTITEINNRTDHLCDHLLGETLPHAITAPDGSTLIAANVKATRARLKIVAGMPATSVCCPTSPEFETFLRIALTPTLDLMRAYAALVNVCNLVNPLPSTRALVNRIESVLQARHAMTYLIHRNAPTVTPW